MARKKKEVYHVKLLTEGKKNIISARIDEYDCFLQVQIPEMGVRTFFWTVSTPVTSVIVKQTFFLKIAVACKYLISKDWLCLAIEL